MPVYEFKPGCSCRGKKVFEVVRSMSRAGEPEYCPDCRTAAERLYTFSKAKEFIPFYDEQFKTVISSIKHEERLMKKHKQVYTRDTNAYGKFKEQVNIARRKPVHFIPGVKSVHIDRN